jgi:hypothetical protein
MQRLNRGIAFGVRSTLIRHRRCSKRDSCLNF